MALLLTNADPRARQKAGFRRRRRAPRPGLRRLSVGESGPAIALVANIAQAGTKRDDLPWLKLPAGAILAVPRLGLLAEPAAFEAEVRTRFADAGASVEWLAAPALP